MTDALVSTDRFAAMLGTPGVAVLDCTYVDAGLRRDPAAEFAAAHIPGARFLDLKAVSDPDTSLPTMLPPPALFASRMRALGLGDRDRIVLYDDSPWRTAARAWVMFRSFGIPDVAILDGGLAKWRAEDRVLTGDAPAVRQRDLAVAARGVGVRDLAAMRANLDGRAEQVVDARSAARFTGAEGDPRPGVAPGHIPGSHNLPYTKLFEADGTWLRGDALSAVFADAGVDPARPLVATCGSGITASAIAFAAHLLGHDVAVYDGSWSEWGADPATPKELG